MARRYVRDNRGRFASVGATARGGRLKTASGNKRRTQTMQASAAPRAGAIRGKVKRDPTAASRVGQSAAAKPKAKTNAAGLTRAEFEAAAQKAWGAAPKKATKKRSQSADQQLDRLVERSGNLARSRTGLTKSEAMKASDLGKATGRNVQVSQNERGGYTIKVAAAAAAKPKASRPVRKLGFTQSDFAARSQRTASIRNPEIRAKAQRLYGRVMDTGQTPKQLRSMFKKAGKPKGKSASAESRRRQREHRDMLATSRVLFR